jgi:hypothetical protein
VDPDPDPGGQKMTHKKRKKFRNFIFFSAGCFLLRAKGFFCSFDVLIGGLGIVAIFDKKKFFFIRL